MTQSDSQQEQKDSQRERPTKLIDSHCHLHLLDLSDFQDDLHHVMGLATEAGVAEMLCVSVDRQNLPMLYHLADSYPNVRISAGIHPNEVLASEPDEAQLIADANHPGCIAIGETGLDYYRTTEPEDQSLQQQRFRRHITAAKETGKPLIIHTRQAAADTMRCLLEERADEIGGVMHCFAEEWAVAKKALDLNFYISFSGIVTFKNAVQLQEVAKKVPLERLLIETDAPFLAPVPFRGKQNHPALVKYVAEGLCGLRGVDFNTLAEKTTENFYRCFRVEPV